MKYMSVNFIAECSMRHGSGLENIEHATESISAAPSPKSNKGSAGCWEAHDSGSTIKHFPSTKLPYVFIIRLWDKSTRFQTAMAAMHDSSKASLPRNSADQD